MGQALSADAPLKAERNRRTYHALDAFRGIAAIVIISRHCDRQLGGMLFPQSFQTVDLFFVMSGAVIANAYKARLQTTMSAREFAKVRLIRLYLLYVVGIAAGFVQVAGNDPPPVWWTPMLALRSWRGVSDGSDASGVSGGVQTRGS